jgi:hypothetical protein
MCLIQKSFVFLTPATSLLHCGLVCYRITDNMFLCGPGTRFDQRSRICQAKDLVDCSLSASLYYLNRHFQLNPPGNGDTYVYTQGTVSWCLLFTDINVRAGLCILDIFHSEIFLCSILFLWKKKRI